MMVISIDMGIPLFIVGKPGSSKSLAKTVVCDVMQGPNSYAEFYKNFKEVHMVSFQCSPLATSEGIIGTFRQCQKYQTKKDLTKLTSVVILDEVSAGWLLIFLSTHLVLGGVGRGQSQDASEGTPPPAGGRLY